MKKNKYFIISCLALGMASCTGDELKNEQEIASVSTSIKRITATVADYGVVTRSELYREDNAINFKWTAGDALGVFPDNGDQVSFSIDNSQAGSLSATFDGGGWGLKPSHTYTAYCPVIRDMDLDKSAIPLDYTGQVQIGNNSYSHLGKYDYMASDAVAPEDGSLNFTMNHLGSIMLLKVTVEEPGTYDFLTLTADNNVFTTKASMNIVGTKPVLTSQEVSDMIKLELVNVATTQANEVLTLSMMVYPVNLSSETLRVSIHRTDGKVFSGVIDNPKNLEQGKPFEMVASIDFNSEDGLIEFADDKVKAICVQYFDINGDGELSYAEAAAVAEIPTKREYFNPAEAGLNTSVDASIFAFKICKEHIYYFNELQYFTSLKEIPDLMFFGQTSLSELTLPNNILSIGKLAFYDCSSLSNVDIPEGVTSIGDGAFRKCSNLAGILIPSSVKNIGRGAFEYCTKLSSANIPNGVETIDYVFSVCRNLTSITIPNSVKSIDGTFSSCESLTNIEIPSSVTNIGSSAFYGCTNLSNITIPNSVKTIGRMAFYGCDSLTNIEIPSSVTTIEMEAFLYCCNLISITIPNSVTIIEEGVFQYCSSLTNVVIPTSVTSIGINAFNGCKGLTNIFIPNSVKNIGVSAFSDCSNLTEITIGNGITTIGGRAFESCSSLTSITILKDEPFIIGGGSSSASLEIPETCTIYVPAGSVEKYNSNAQWAKYADQIQAIPE